MTLTDRIERICKLHADCLTIASRLAEIDLAYMQGSDPDIAEACEFARDRVIERAEHKLAEAIERGESWAVMTALKNTKRGRQRGYGEAIDIDHTGGVTIRLIDETNNDDND